ncbi:MAG: hypothetical protein ACRDF4_07590 [Rhabdochlamydiaceae bacterium]
MIVGKSVGMAVGASEAVEFSTRSSFNDSRTSIALGASIAAICGASPLVGEERSSANNELKEWLVGSDKTRQKLKKNSILTRGLLLFLLP